MIWWVICAFPSAVLAMGAVDLVLGPPLDSGAVSVLSVVGVLTGCGGLDNDGDVDAFFKAALHLRFGIDARLHEYLDSRLKALGQDPTKASDYIASKLLKRFVAADPRAEFDGGVHMMSEQTALPRLFSLWCPEPASIHGKLGGLLHFSFFRNNPECYIRTTSRDEKIRTLLDHRKVLDQAISELTRATPGRLLSHPRFTGIVEEIIDEGANDNSR